MVNIHEAEHRHCPGVFKLEIARKEKQGPEAGSA
jgi:hypothetical protein